MPQPSAPPWSFETAALHKIPHAAARWLLEQVRGFVAAPAREFYEQFDPLAVRVAKKVAKRFAYMYGEFKESVQVARVILFENALKWLRAFVAAPEKSLYAFLHDRVYNHLQSTARKERRAKARFARAPRLVTQGFLQDMGCGGGHTHPRLPRRAAEDVLHLMDTLAPVDQEVLQACVEGCSPEQIAERLGLSKDNVRRRLKKLWSAIAAVIVTTTLFAITQHLHCMARPRSLATADRAAPAAAEKLSPEQLGELTRAALRVWSSDHAQDLGAWHAYRDGPRPRASEGGENLADSAVGCGAIRGGVSDRKALGPDLAGRPEVVRDDAVRLVSMGARWPTEAEWVVAARACSRDSRYEVFDELASSSRLWDVRLARSPASETAWAPYESDCDLSNDLRTRWRLTDTLVDLDQVDRLDVALVRYERALAEYGTLRSRQEGRQTSATRNAAFDLSSSHSPFHLAAFTLGTLRSHDVTIVNRDSRLLVTALNDSLDESPSCRFATRD